MICKSVFASHRIGPRTTKKAKAEAANQRIGGYSGVKYAAMAEMVKNATDVAVPMGSSMLGIIAAALPHQKDNILLTQGLWGNA